MAKIIDIETRQEYCKNKKIPLELIKNNLINIENALRNQGDTVNADLVKNIIDKMHKKERKKLFGVF